MTDSNILTVHKLTKTYVSGNNALTVLKEISFSLPTGAACAVVGPSGSGKTTLLGLCAGLDQPTSGEVVLAGYKLHSLTEDERARVRNEKVGFVFQDFQLIPNLTALENVMVPLELQRGVGNDVLRRGTDLLYKVGLGDRLEHYPSQLSGGEQQRVGIARAFINQPRILFADEPTGNLDDETAAAVVESLFELNHSFGTSLVLVTHNLELARRTQRVLQLKRGMMVEHEGVKPDSARETMRRGSQ